MLVSKIGGNIKLLVKCFQKGFFAEYRRDLISLSIIGLFLIVSWIFFGIFGFFQQNHLILLIFHIGAVVVGVTGLMILLYFLKNIKNLEYEFKEKTKLRLKLDKILNKLEKEIEESDQFKNQVILMADNITGLGMWIKDKDNRYIFADKTLRDKLYNGIFLDDIIGKTDTELQYGEDAEEYQLPPIHNEAELENLVIDRQNVAVCNLTDEITKYLKKPCRFYEFIGDSVYDVWKAPLIENGEIKGTVGCLSEVTNIVDAKYIDLENKIINKEAYKIDGTPNYYIKRYNFNKKCDWCPFNKTQK